MAHFYLITSMMSYTRKDTNTQVMEPFSCILMGNSKLDKITQDILENISLFAVAKYIEQKELTAEKVKELDRNIMGINYLGEMSKEEFVDSEQAVFKDLSGKEQIIVPSVIQNSKDQVN